MENVQLSVVHKLPLSYRWLAGFTGTRVEILPENDASRQNTLIGLKLLSHDGMTLDEAIQNLQKYLNNLNIENVIGMAYLVYFYIVMMSAQHFVA